MNFAIFARVSGEIDLERMIAAVRETQCQYPLATVAISRAPDSASLQFRTVATPVPVSHTNCGANWANHLADDAIAPFALDTGPLIRGFLYSIGAERTVLSLVFHHSIADGRSAFSFMRHVFELYLGNTHENARSKIVSPMGKFLPPREGGGVDGPNTAQLLDVSVVPGLSTRSSFAVPRVEVVEVSAAATEAVRRILRRERVTLHAFLAASQLKALLNLFPTVTGNEISQNLCTPVDARALLPGSPKHSSLGSYVTFLYSHFKIEKGASVIEIGKMVTKDILLQLYGQDRLRFSQTLADPAPFLRSERAIRAFTVLTDKVAEASVLTSLGVIADFSSTEAFAVETVGSVQQPAASQSVCVTATEYAGGLTLCLNYDASRWREPLFGRFLREYRRILLSDEFK